MTSTGMKIFLGIALAVILFGLFNLGVATFYPSPDYDDYCGKISPIQKLEWTEQECVDEGGVWEDQYCNFYKDCQDEYQITKDSYNNKIFYFFVIAGLILAVLGLFITYLPFQIVGIGTGTGLIIEGILRNLQDKIPAFIAGTLVFIVLSYFVWRKVKD